MCLMFAVFGAANSWAFDFKPGKYEITSSVDMPGMPQGSIPAQVFVHCITEDDPVPRSDASASGCEVKNVKQDGNTFTWEMECTQQGQKMTSKGEITYSGNSFEGTTVMMMGSQTITTHMSGKRLGACD